MIQKTFRNLINAALAMAALTLLSATALAQYPVGNSHLSDMKPGSILFYNRYTSSPSNPQQSDTQINITNVSQTLSADVHLFLVDGSSCSIADSFMGLTPNQTASFLVSDFDPGVQGYIVAVATSGFAPVRQNTLIGTEFIRETDGSQGFLQAIAIARRSPDDVVPNGDGTASLIFNDAEYERLPNVLALATFNSQTTDTTSLAIYSPSADLIIGSVVSTSVFSLLYNDVEVPLSSSFTISCYRFATLTALFNRGGGINNHIPAGRTGWIRFTSSGRPILGSVIGKGPVFTGAHNLHALSLLSTYTISVPSF